jgi:hypothetical protein
MKNVFIGCLLLIGASTVAAQNNILEQVEQQIWFPFMKALQQKDSAAYASLHHPSVVRISNDRNGVYQQGQDYYNYIGRWFATAPAQSIGFRFTERVASDKVVSWVLQRHIHQ